MGQYCKIFLPIMHCLTNVPGISWKRYPLLPGHSGIDRYVLIDWVLTESTFYMKSTVCRWFSIKNHEHGLSAFFTFLVYIIINNCAIIVIMINNNFCFLLAGGAIINQALTENRYVTCQILSTMCRKYLSYFDRLTEEDIINFIRKEGGGATSFFTLLMAFHV